MLYTCSCVAFDKTKNNFRLFASTFIVRCFKKILLNSHSCLSIPPILVIFFEAGGLAQEYEVLSYLVASFPHNIFYVVLFESSSDKKVFNAYIDFKKKFETTPNLFIYYLHSLEALFDETKLSEISYSIMFLASFDPYFYFCFTYRDKIHKTFMYDLSLEVYLYVYDGYRYQQMLEFFIFQQRNPFIHGFYAFQGDFYSIKEKEVEL